MSSFLIGGCIFVQCLEGSLSWTWQKIKDFMERYWQCCWWYHFYFDLPWRMRSSICNQSFTVTILAPRILLVGYVANHTILSHRKAPRILLEGILSHRNPSCRLCWLRHKSHYSRPYRFLLHCWQMLRD
jgi:hypothetical protein